MARTNIPVTNLVANGVLANPAGTALDPTNGHVVTLPCPLEEVVIRVTHTAASEKDVTIVAGEDPPADAAGQGDLVEAFAAGNETPVTKWIGPLTSARFIQADGTLHVDVEASATGTIAVLRVPRNA